MGDLTEDIKITIQKKYPDAKMIVPVRVQYDWYPSELMQPPYPGVSDLTQVDRLTWEPLMVNAALYFQVAYAIKHRVALVLVEGDD